MIAASRRGFIAGALALVAAPTIVRAASLMPVNSRLQPSPLLTLDDWARGLLRHLPEYVPGEDTVGSYDVLFGHKQMRPEWSLFTEIDRQYDEQFGAEGAKIGDVLRIRLPNDFIVADGPAISLQVVPPQYVEYYLGQRRPALPVIPEPLALAVAAVAVAPVLLEKSVTRRFWGK